jgi:parallel beta-helix repeat protein
MVATVFTIVAVPVNTIAEVPEDLGIPGDPEDPIDPENMEFKHWWVNGTGTFFEVVNLDYLSVTLTSSETVNIHLESVPRVVSYHIESPGSAVSADITLTGFDTCIIYYRYQDGYLQEQFTPDETGSYAYTQDISVAHHVFIAQEASTKYIRDDATGGDGSSIGIWDWPTKTLTLTTDVYETIMIEDNGITLDGNGYNITRGSGSYGVYATNNDYLTFRNLNVSGFSYGVLLSRANNCVVTASTISGSYRTVLVSSANNPEISFNTITSNKAGLYLSFVGGILVTDNHITSGEVGIEMMAIGTFIRNTMIGGGMDISGDLIFWIYNYIDTSNTVNGKPVYYYKEVVGPLTVPDKAGQVILGKCQQITIENQEDLNGGIDIGHSSWNTIRFNNILNNYRNGIELHVSDDNIISDNVIDGRNYKGIDIVYGSRNLVTRNTITGIIPIHAREDYDTMITDNTITSDPGHGSGRGIDSPRSYGMTISENTIAAYKWGISSSSGSDWTITDNHITTSLSGSSIVGIRQGGNINSIITGNTMIGGGFYFYGSNLEQWNTHTIDTTNTINGKPLYYWKDRVGGTIPDDAGQVILANCQDIVVEDLNLPTRGGSVAVTLGFSSGNTVRNNYFYGLSSFGVWLEHSDNNMISDNYLYGRAYGIITRYSSSNTITRNTAIGSSAGIEIQGDSYYPSDNNIITENVASGGYRGIRIFIGSGNQIIGNTANGYYGIIVDYSENVVVSENTIPYGPQGLVIQYTYNSLFTKNVITVYYWGIVIISSTGNTFTYNTITAHSSGYPGTGVMTYNNADGNTFHHNNFIGNDIQVGDPGINNWDDGAGEGNYWSDYTGLDNGDGGRTAGDGVGDTDLPHLGLDSYPLMSPWTPNDPPVANAGPDQTVIVGETVNFDGSGSYDPDGVITSYDWDFDDSNSGTGVAPTHTYSTDGTHSVTLTVTDDDGATDSDTVTITVITLEQGLRNLIKELNEIIENNPGTPLADKIEDARDKVVCALEELEKSPPDNQAVVGNLEGAVGDIEAAVKDDLLDLADGIYLIDQAVRVARQLAVNAIMDAIERGGDPDSITEAQGYLDEGDVLRASGLSGNIQDFKEAVNKYKDALAKAESA